MRDYWHKQTDVQPLFPDLLWSRPETKSQSGKLLVVGGNAHGFAAAAEAYGAALKSGLGTARVLLPDSLQKTVGRVFEAGEYVPSTPSGSFSRQSLAELLATAQWADATLLAGDFGRNSETAVLLEQFSEKHSGQLTLTQDAADYFIKQPASILARPETLLVISFAQLQKIAVSIRFTTAFTFDMDFLRLVDALHEFSTKYQATLIVKHLLTILVAVDGQVSTTALGKELPIWRVRTASKAVVWWLQNPSKTFQALTTAVLSKNADD